MPSCAVPPLHKKVLGEDGDLWSTKCETKVDVPFSRFLLRSEFEVERFLRFCISVELGL